MSSYIHKPDFNLGPVSVDQICKNLYLGGLAAAKDIETLKKLKITHILTIDTCPLPRNILELGHISKKFIQLADLPNEDLLSHLDDTFSFIDSAIENNGVVLVHCYFGVSRSATIVIAYVMKKNYIGLQEAQEIVRAKRSIVHPNQGFISQLKLYYDMGCCIDRTYMHYKIYRLGKAAALVRNVKVLPSDYLDLIEPDPGLATVQPNPNVYKCKKCRRVVATDSNLLVHKDKNQPCKRMYFIEPVRWMQVTQHVEGKLHCPQCDSKLGSFSWIKGCECPCGVKVAPAFYLTPSKVDFSNVVQNVEMTF